MTLLRANERSEAIELIKESQKIFDLNDFVFKEAAGEQSLGRTDNLDNRANFLFPDVLYYLDKGQNEVAVGWELKLPDTDIYDDELLSNAIDKANRLNTNVIILFNFKYTLLYCRRETSWTQIKIWDDLKCNNNRNDVINNRDKWKKLLLEIIIFLNNMFLNKQVKSISLSINSSNIASNIASKYADSLADYYIQSGNRILEAQITKWYNNEIFEYKENINQVSYLDKAKLFAKNILLKWINRITFANIIKNRHNLVKVALDSLLDNNITFEEIRTQFNEAILKSDFYTILFTDENDIFLSVSIKDILREYTSFIYSKQYDDFDNKTFSDLLEGLINVSKRQVMGLFVTPQNLAKLLVFSSVESTKGEFADPCTGSGTIGSTIMNLVAKSQGLMYAHNHVWLWDKYNFPLQIANMSITQIDSLHLPNLVFQQDLLTFQPNDCINFVDPSNGTLINKVVPKFNYIAANLPFIRSERYSKIEYELNKLIEINKLLFNRNISELALKNDWYQFAIIALERLLEEDGVLSVIISNSWLKTKNKDNFILTLFKLFEIKNVIISTSGRWFKNADVITTIITLKKKSNSNKNVKFIRMKSNILQCSDKDIDNISKSLLLEEKSNVFYDVCEYSKFDIENFIDNGISLNILFHNFNWFKKLTDKIIPMTDVFEGRRGVKSTNDKFFYDISANIEDEYIKPVLKTPSSINNFYAKSDSNAFVVRESLEDLINFKKQGAIKYIKSYIHQEKTKSQEKLVYWYQFPDVVTGDFVTSINPEQRLFWAMTPRDLIINQRLTVFKLKEHVSVDRVLIHALLNSYYGQLMIEATGFGRGLGVLDTTKDGILDSTLLNYNLISSDKQKLIISLWEKLSKNEVPNILEQLDNQEWYNFNKVIFASLGIVDLLPSVINTLKDSINMRISVR